MNLPNWHYYEAHVTIDPMFDDALEKFQTLCLKNGFRVAKLLMQKIVKDTPERSNKDSFCTGRDESFDYLKSRMLNLISDLETNNFIVRRFKIESTLLDSKYNDSDHPLQSKT